MARRIIFKDLWKQSKLNAKNIINFVKVVWTSIRKTVVYVQLQESHWSIYSTGVLINRKY